MQERPVTVQKALREHKIQGLLLTNIEEGYGGMRIERMVHITKDGPEFLDSHLPAKLFEFVS